MLNSLLQDGVSNNAGQLVIETVPVQGTDCWANSLCDEAGSRSHAPISAAQYNIPECFVQFRRNIPCGKCCTTLLNATSCGVGRIRSILKHTR